MIGWETRAGQKFRFDGFWRNAVPRKFNFLRFQALHLEISERVSERGDLLKMNVLFLNRSTHWLTNIQLIPIMYFKGSGKNQWKYSSFWMLCIECMSLCMFDLSFILAWRRVCSTTPILTSILTTSCFTEKNDVKTDWDKMWGQRHQMYFYVSRSRFLPAARLVNMCCWSRGGRGAGEDI